MHEQSETIQNDQGRWINVYGQRTPQAGQPLPRKYPFEQDDYDSVQDAERAARKRSQLEGMPRKAERVIERGMSR